MYQPDFVAVAKVDKENQRKRGLGNDRAALWHLRVRNKRSRKGSGTLTRRSWNLRAAFPSVGTSR